MQEKKEYLKTTSRMRAIILPPQREEGEGAPAEKKSDFVAQSVLRAALIMVVVHLFSRILGLLREVLLSKHFGAGQDTDAFFIGETICVFFALFFGESIAYILVTIFSEYRAKGDEKTAWAITSSVTNIVIILMFFVAGGIFFFAPYFIPLIYGIHDPAKLAITIGMVRWMVPIVVFGVLMEISIGVFEAHKSFTLPSMYFVIINSFIVSGIFFLDTYFDLGIRSAAFGYSAGIIFVAVLFWYVLWKKTRAYTFSFDWRHPGTKKVFWLLIPMFLAKCSYMLLGVIDQAFATHFLPTGSLSALSYGYMLFFLVPSFFILALQKAFFPSLSDHIQDGEKDEASELFHTVIDLLMYLIVPVGIFFFLFSDSIVRIVYERGEFSQTATQMTSDALSFYAVGMLFAAMVELTKAVFFAFQNTKIALKTQIFMIFLNTALNGLFIYLGYQIMGLALASSIAEGVVVVILLYLLHKHLMPLDVFGFIKSFIGIAILAVGGNLICLRAFHYIKNEYSPTGSLEELMALVASFAAGGLVYIAVSFILRFHATKLLWEILDERILCKLPFWPQGDEAKDKTGDKADSEDEGETRDEG